MVLIIWIQLSLMKREHERLLFLRKERNKLPNSKLNICKNYRKTVIEIYSIRKNWKNKIKRNQPWLNLMMTKETKAKLPVNAQSAHILTNCHFMNQRELFMERIKTKSISYHSSKRKGSYRNHKINKRLKKGKQREN